MDELREAIKLIPAAARLQVVEGAGHGVPPATAAVHARMAFGMSESLSERIEQVEHRIQTAVQRSGRTRDEITLVAVTKKFSAAVICEAYALGLRVFGENYVQEFAEKHPALASLTDAQFHLIGHLQSNKARLAAELFHAIETVDSEKLARRLDEAGKPAGSDDRSEALAGRHQGRRGSRRIAGPDRSDPQPARISGSPD